MCGIYGYIGKPVKSEKVLQLIELLAVNTEIRGTHATGYYAVTANEILTAKAPMKASDFIKTSAYNKLYTKVPNIFLGHNRWASHGKPENNENNHPFWTNRFGFIHNGIVGYHPDIATIRSECDSEYIFRYFLKRFYNDHNHWISIEKTMTTFEERNGDYACAMVDSKERTLWMFKNESRPICWIRLEQLGIVVFASTKEIMEKSLKEAKIQYDKEKLYYMRTGQISCFKEDLTHEKKMVETVKPVFNVDSWTKNTNTSKWSKYSSTKTYEPFTVRGSANTRPFPIIRKPDVTKERQELLEKMKSSNPTHNITDSHYECRVCHKKFIGGISAVRHLKDAHEIFKFEEINTSLKVY